MIAQTVALLILTSNIVIRHERNLADIGSEDVHWLGEAGRVTTERIADQFSAFFDRGTEMVDAGGGLTVKDVVRLDPYRQQFLMQFTEGLDIVVDPFKQHGLIPDVDTTREQIEHRLGRGLGDFLRMVALGIDPDRDTMISAKNLFSVPG